jgi:hypothetical protein
MPSNNKNLLTQKEVTKKWVEITIERFKKKIDNLKLIYSGNLKNSLVIHLISSANGNVERLKLAYLLYGQFQDMGVGRGQKFEDIKSNGEQIRAAGMKGRSPKKWYSKTIYAEVNALADILMKQYGLQAETAILENLPTTININL